MSTDTEPSPRTYADPLQIPGVEARLDGARWRVYVNGSYRGSVWEGRSSWRHQTTAPRYQPGAESMGGYVNKTMAIRGLLGRTDPQVLR